MVSFSLFATALGDCGIAWRGDVVVATRLPDRTSSETAHRMATRTGGTQNAPPIAIQNAIASITALLAGERVDLGGIACDIGNVDPFATQVYAITRSIPAGETLTYGAIAEQLGDKSRAHQVGQALGRNPVPIIVPCHRVMGADGKLVGFSADGGVEMKLRMLAIEGAQLGKPPGLFGDLPLMAKPKR